MLCYNDHGNITEIVDMRDIRIPGMHNVENYLTAIAATWGEVSAENIRKVAKEFNGVEHRIEFVRELDGVKYYNNSIASSLRECLPVLLPLIRSRYLFRAAQTREYPLSLWLMKYAESVKFLY